MRIACIIFIALLTGVTAFANFDNTKGNGTRYTIVDRDADRKTAVKNNFQSFNVTRQGKNIQVNWVASDAYNDQYYALERSTNGNDWKQIAIALGTDASAAASQFAFVDKNITHGVVFYRIRQISATGSDHYSTVRSIRNSRLK